ncbi:SNF2-related protein [Marispirochaeta aestuarii]|uniref:SNF2-related protein n=1 Tax=Marispirochaeta aestuarii TaxID=1963862 RepID=UPI0029C60EBF|nr:SNF2-related protein [Marispirochaeta aestuarii]
MDWDPAQPNILVALRDNPGKMGYTTGKTKGSGSRLMVQVRYGPSEAPYKRCSLLVPVQEDRGIEDILDDGDFGTPEDLRKIIVLEKLKGQLTNVLYSMEDGNTDFYAHQFKPVLKFIESIQGKLLVADEVGLGKTIEAIYIWKELQARSDARRLLIVCPAMLREKWQNDLYTRFGIDGEILDAGSICTSLEKVISRRDNRGFVYIASMEGLRPPAYYMDREGSRNSRVRLAQLIEEFGEDTDNPLFDLVIIDEAHYMRNPETASFRLGRLLRDAARNLLLLTATPIQTEEGNLYQLLRLIDPDVFSNYFTFDNLLKVNRPILHAITALQRNPLNAGELLSVLDKMEAEDISGNDRALKGLRESLLAEGTLGVRERAEYTAMLESRSVLAPYMNRTRKRDVMENRVVRNAIPLIVNYSPLELELYWKISAAVLREAKERTGIPGFLLISRQRQMASSLVAALENWQRGDYWEILQEWLWEDLGYTDDLAAETSIKKEVENLLHRISDTDLKRLKKEDSKYRTLVSTLKKIYRHNRQEKCIIFAFYRDTLRYLNERLTSEGFRVAVIMGGIRPAEKMQILRDFESSTGEQILLSSEVGSEGIDLQFCSVLFNYDLPWNPMRVEQRIGRIDRLGQKSEKIHIYNFASFDTVEERILTRLYERIGIFRESVGDLEEILGEVTTELMESVYNPELSDEEKEKRAEATFAALENRRRLQNTIEENAINLIGFSDYIYRNIQSLRDNNRWISRDDLLTFVTDFFSFNYKGTILEQENNGFYRFSLSLSQEARNDLSGFIVENKPQRSTRLHSLERVRISFEKDEILPKYEKIDLLHPLILWIRRMYELKPGLFHPVSAIEIDYESSISGLPFVRPGTFFYRVQRWKMTGLKEYQQMIFLCSNREHDLLLEEIESEQLVMHALVSGRKIVNARNLLFPTVDFTDEIGVLDEILTRRFEKIYEERSYENRRLCNTQRESACLFKERRVKELQDRIARFRENGNTRMIPATEGLIRKEEITCRNKIARIEAMEVIDADNYDLAAGVIQVV